MRHYAPTSAGSGDVNDGVYHFALAIFSWSAGYLNREQGFHRRPFCVGQIGWVSFSFAHDLVLSSSLSF